MREVGPGVVGLIRVGGFYAGGKMLIFNQPRRPKMTPFWGGHVQPSRATWHALVLPLRLNQQMTRGPRKGKRYWWKSRRLIVAVSSKNVGRVLCQLCNLYMLLEMATI